jgi:hypothetical protein
VSILRHSKGTSPIFPAEGLLRGAQSDIKPKDAEKFNDMSNPKKSHKMVRMVSAVFATGVIAASSSLITQLPPASNFSTAPPAPHRIPIQIPSRVITLPAPPPTIAAPVRQQAPVKTLPEIPPTAAAVKPTVTTKAAKPKPKPKAPSTTTPAAHPSIAVVVTPPVEVCAVLYLWYGFNETTQTWTGGNGTSHWNDAPPGIVKDVPVGGYYASPGALPRQIEEMKKAGIDCVVPDWLGPGFPNFAQPNITNPLDLAVNTEMNLLFKDAKIIDPTMKIAIMVDAFNPPTAPLTPQDYQSLYSYVNKAFYTPYSSQILQWQGAPLLMFFNEPNSNPTGSPGFTTRVIGNNNTDISPGWWFWTAPASLLTNVGGAPFNPCAQGFCGPTVSPDGFVSIIPRYDDYYLYASGARTSYLRADPTYTQGLYQTEWNYVLGQQKANNNIKMVMIYSWNEYNERSEIEPHDDFTANNTTFPPNYLLKVTAANIAALQRS